MRRWIWIAGCYVLVLGCGGASPPAAETTGPAAVTTVRPVPTEVPPTTRPIDTTPSSSGEPVGQGPEPDRSILGLGLGPDDARSGRFRLQPGPASETLMPLAGRYWVGEGGDVYTALDIDTAKIAEQMALLVAALESTGAQTAQSPYLTSLRQHYRGDQFQIGLTDLIRYFAVGGLPAEWAEQWGWFIEADDNPIPPELTACRLAIGELDLAARKWVSDLPIAFDEDTWTFPVMEFEQALRAEIEQAAICEEFVEIPGPSAKFVFALSGDRDQRRIEVRVDDGTYADAEPELLFTIVMRPDESVGSPPPVRDPAGLLSLRGSYLTAIAVCGELPWIYSNFAAANTYYGPASDGYDGPLVFASGWYCEEDVPANQRSDDG